MPLQSVAVSMQPYISLAMSLNRIGKSGGRDPSPPASVSYRDRAAYAHDAQLASWADRVVFLRDGRVVDEATHPWGLKCNRIEIKDIQPPKDLIDSMARQMKAEREKRANILEAEGFRQAAILKAEGEKQATILSAEGKREAAFREAEARERLAEAEAKATTMVSEAIEKGDINAINYFVATKYVDALKAMVGAPNQKIMLLPMEATGILGSLAGIAELARSSLEQQQATKAAAKPA